MLQGIFNSCPSRGQDPRARWVPKGSHLSNFRGKCLKGQSPVSRLPYLEVRKQETEVRKATSHTNVSPFLCTTKASIRAWAHLDPQDPHGTVPLLLTCVGRHSTSLGSGRQDTPLNHAKLELKQPAPCSSQPQAPGAKRPTSFTQSKKVALLNMYLGF